MRLPSLLGVALCRQLLQRRHDVAESPLVPVARRALAGIGQRRGGPGHEGDKGEGQPLSGEQEVKGGGGRKRKLFEE